MLSAGIVRSDNALVVSFVKLFLFPNLLSCILFAWTCFFIATISTGPSSWGDPLPTGLHPQVVSLAPYRLQDVWEDVRRIGNVLGNPDRAQTLIQHYQQRLDDLRHKTAVFGFEPRVAVLEWHDPLMGAGNWTPELVSYAGGKN